MKKHEANEVVREVNFRANQVATQLLLGAIPESVTDMEVAFLSSGTYSFNAIKNPTNSNQFKIVMTAKTDTKISENVCRQIYSQLGDNNVIRAIGQENNFTSSDGCVGGLNTLSFVFNNDMSKGKGSDKPDTQSDLSVCNGHGIIRKGVCDCFLGYSGPQCSEGAEEPTCIPSNVGNGYKYIALDGTGYNGCLCKRGYFGPACESEGDQCSGHGRWFVFESGGQKQSLCICDDKYTGTACDKEDGTCLSNSDCAKGEYCKITRITNNGVYYVEAEGVCISADVSDCDNVDPSNTACYGGMMNWFSATNWCSARGGNLTGSWQLCQIRNICERWWTKQTDVSVRQLKEATYNYLNNGAIGAGWEQVNQKLHVMCDH